MGIRDEEFDPTERQQHQAELRKQLLRPNTDKPAAEKDTSPPADQSGKPVKGKHRKTK